MKYKGRADRESALALLDKQHVFPGPYVFRIVVRPSVATTVVTAVGAVLREPDEPGGDAGSPGVLTEVVERQSRSGRYVALHLHTRMRAAEGVLDVYEVISQLEGVLMTL
jgi:putative lipoic acid-binding regulatory protein